MILILLFVVVPLALFSLPQIWVRRVMDRYAVERPDLGRTGAEYARAALDRLALGHVKVEATGLGNHYDPVTKTIRLEPRFLSGRSLSATVVAAHEIGHAMQDAMRLPMFQRRQAITRQTRTIAHVAQLLVWSAPVLMLLGKGRVAVVVNGAGIVAMTLLALALQMTTLPVEIDASFKRALPLLQQNPHLQRRDLIAARRLLWAAALTYVTGFLQTILRVPSLRTLTRW